MSETLTPAKSASTTTPRNTHIEVEHTLGEGVLLYRPEDNAFIALYPDEWLACREEADINTRAIEELQLANGAVTDMSLALQELLQQPNAAQAELVKAQQDLDKALEQQVEKGDAAKKRIEAITDQKTDPDKLVELLFLTPKRSKEKIGTPIYISAKRLKAAMADKRIYLVEGPAERAKPPKEKLFDGTRLNVNELRNRFTGHVRDRVKFEKKWKLAPDGADRYAGILTEWAKVMGTTATACLERGKNDIANGLLKGVNTDPNSPERMLDLKAEAQFMRWAGGAGIETNFMPFQGSLSDKRDRTVGQKLKRVAGAAQFNIKANAEASFAIGEAKVETSLYLPHAAGWNLKPGNGDMEFNFGYFRLRGELKLYALAGASIALEAGAALMITAGKQGLRGTPKEKRGVKAKLGGKAEAQVFAGLKEGVALTGTLQWLNPEGFIDPKGPKKVDINKVLAKYVDMASIGTDAAFIQGISAKLGFECEYRDGKFVIAAKASSCLGLGGEGNVAAKVGIAEIGQFVMFVAHQLKQADYKKIAFLMSAPSFFLLNQMLYLNVIAGQKLENFIGVQEININELYNKTTSTIVQRGTEAIKKLENQLKSGWGWYAYMPPEARGALISSISTILQAPENLKNMEMRKIAAFSVNELMATIQSPGHFFNTIDRVTTLIGKDGGRDKGVKIIESIVKDTAFDGCLNRCEFQVQKSSPLLGRPFLRNDFPEFKFAQFPLHHTNYMNSNYF
jgi:hypothetical protein